VGGCGPPWAALCALACLTLSPALRQVRDWKNRSADLDQTKLFQGEFGPFRIFYLEHKRSDVHFCTRANMAWVGCVKQWRSDQRNDLLRLDAEYRRRIPKQHRSVSEGLILLLVRSGRCQHPTLENTCDGAGQAAAVTGSNTQ
jgi:hypothetical protein